MEETRQDQQEERYEKVSFFPPNVTPTVQRKAIELSEKVREIDIRCFMMLNKFRDGMTAEDTIDAKELCDERIDTSDDVMRLLAGDETCINKYNL